MIILTFNSCRANSIVSPASETFLKPCSPLSFAMCIFSSTSSNILDTCFCLSLISFSRSNNDLSSSPVAFLALFANSSTASCTWCNFSSKSLSLITIVVELISSSFCSNSFSFAMCRWTSSWTRL